MHDLQYTVKLQKYWRGSEIKRKTKHNRLFCKMQTL